MTSSGDRAEFRGVEDGSPVGGQLRYDRRLLSFDFAPADPAVARRWADAVELVFGSVALQVDRSGIARGGGEVLGAWGYHPDAGWLNGSLGSPTATPTRLTVRLPRTPPRGVALRLVRAEELTTIRDLRTGWIRIGRTGVHTGTRMIEFATGCLAELSGGDNGQDGGEKGGALVALWLRPAQRQMEASPVSNPNPA